ncbi:MAG: MFS transporter [Candidatus Lambdaproteobacteria bacterium]|nr:MFS transporter [Candidatus Lambdaproteobacteria bacterium]
MSDPSALAQSAPPRERVITPLFARLFLGFLLSGMNTSMFHLLPHYLELRGASEALYGAVAGSLGMLNFLSAMALGSRADLWSRKVSVNVYLGVAAVGNLVAILAMHGPLGWYLLVRALQGVQLGIGMPVALVWAVELGPPSRRNEVVAWLGLAGHAGTLLGPMLAEALIASHPAPQEAAAYLHVFWTGTLLVGLAAAVFSSVPNVQPPRGARRERSLLPLLARREARWLLAMFVVFGGVWGIVISYGKNYAALLGLSYASVWFGASTAGAMLSRGFIGRLTHWFGPRRLIEISLVGIAAGLLLLVPARGYGLLAVSGLVYGLSHGVLFPTLYVRYLDMLEPSHAGRAGVLVQGIFALGWGVFPYLGAFAIRYGGFGTLYGAMAALTLATLLAHRQVERLLKLRREVIA